MIKPMLAGKADLSKIEYPVLVSPKIDGVRALIHDSKVYSRTGKLIPNKGVQEKFGKKEYEGFDGELISGYLFDPYVFKSTTSIVMSHDKSAESIKLYVFDKWDRDYSYRDFDGQPYTKLGLRESNDDVKVLRGEYVFNEESLLRFEENYLLQGAEGVMIRKLNSPYKFGRSTVREGYLLKLKRFSDDEADVVDIEPLVRKDGTIDHSMLGALVVMRNGVKFRIGSGFDEKDRKELMRNPPIHECVKFKFFEIGEYDAPRFPVFLGIRDRMDT